MTTRKYHTIFQNDQGIQAEGFIYMGFPDSLVGKESACMQCRRPEFDPWLGKIPWRRERLPTLVFQPRELHGLYSSWGHKELDMTERLIHTHTHTHCYHKYLKACLKPHPDTKEEPESLSPSLPSIFPVLTAKAFLYLFCPDLAIVFTSFHRSPVCVWT